jgi:hypothetical protein
MPREYYFRRRLFASLLEARICDAGFDGSKSNVGGLAGHTKCEAPGGSCLTKAATAEWETDTCADALNLRASWRLAFETPAFDGRKNKRRLNLMFSGG